MPENELKTYPQKYSHEEVETRWRRAWDESGIFRWRPDSPREDTYIVDTPPPTVSGSLHVGHAYSYAQTDMIVRFQRMLGKNIFYPMGWDDNGLPTERRAQNVFNIRCDPHKPYDPQWKPGRDRKETEWVSRRNFIEACETITREDEQAFETMWRKLGLSVDWDQVYTTIGSHCRRISQYSFLDLVEKGRVVHQESVTMWDVDFRTAVSQAEVEDREVNGAFHDLRFCVQDGESFIISTTRPELLPACIAVAAHPHDSRYSHLFGRTALTPLFHAPVPIVASTHADPEKGSGILMICTFGDFADVEWWRESGLPSRQVIGMDGRLLAVDFAAAPFASRDPRAANQAYAQLAGLSIKAARARILELLAREGSAADGGAGLSGAPRPVTHTVRFYEKGDRPLEFIPTRQWFIRILDIKAELLAQGARIHWHPAYMRARYDHWVEGLNQEWCISRQRYFGVPIPVWYAVDDSGRIDYSQPLFPDSGQLPVDPLIDAPPGFSESQRNQAGGFAGEEDVMDTWNTSSLTPQISSHWGIDAQRHARLFPADLRPQAHDIIRTWAFYTIAKAWMHHQEIPWKHAAISGFILDPDRKKMSKSKGNVMTPESLLDAQSADVFRYWAARGRLGVDSAFDETLFKIGRKLVIKLFNASKFVLTQLDEADAAGAEYDLSMVCSEPDRGWIRILRETIDTAGRALENYDYTSALAAVEDTFWNFCDNYLELVKVKAYDAASTAESRSALATLEWSLRVFLRLFAPFLPYISEEIWSWRYGSEGSIHIAAWPGKAETESVAAPAHDRAFAAAVEVISAVRGHKTRNQTSLRTPVVAWTIRGAREDLEMLESMMPCIMDVAVADAAPEMLALETAPEGESRFQIEVQLGEPPSRPIS
ncbi:MAG: valine--tRNA ligase [Acidobacteriota bacterium]|jgi:valyl-tRNA synthetase|nr:valine--tRNA ligase [Acidobacteriota bacterium]